MARENYKVPPDVSSQSDDLLRIIHNGIDDIIVRLKNAVDLKGNVGAVGDIARTNDAVKKILEVFNNFQNGLVPETGQMKEFDGTDLTPIFYGENKLVVELPTGLLKKNRNHSQDIAVINTHNEANILDLNTNINYNDYNRNGYSPDIELTNDPQTHLKLNTRLRNCITLEQFYLAKHEEIIRIFSFVINLFDKYKYAIKVILFLLKNLVRAEQEQRPPPPGIHTTTPGSVTINLPKPLITNIDLLLRDQKNIQTIINGMEKVVNETHSSISVDPNINTAMKESLNTLGSPPQQPQPSSV